MRQTNMITCPVHAPHSSGSCLTSRDRGRNGAGHESAHACTQRCSAYITSNHVVIALPATPPDVPDAWEHDDLVRLQINLNQRVRVGVSTAFITRTSRDLHKAGVVRT